MSDIKITVRDKIAIAPLGKVVVGSNTSYRIVFSFDDEWTENAKTARFTFGGSYIDVPFTGNTVNMPLIDGVDRAYVGVYAGNMRTTSPALLCMRSSIKSGGVPHSAPTQDVYEQIMALLDGNMISSATINGSGSLIFTREDGETVNAGSFSEYLTSAGYLTSATLPRYNGSVE